MENDEERQLQDKDQLCHIFSYGVSTLCLVCKTIISGSTSPSSRQRRISNHLASSDHVESMRNLFKLCIPDPVCDVDDGKYLEIVTKSIFDISVLLGVGSSYICQKEEHLVCLICRLYISEITSSFAQIYTRIIQHIESDVHANNIKDICLFYRLDTNDDYLLFHKSILHCSLCQMILECKETELLKTAVSHLESNSHEVRLHFKRLNIEKGKISNKESVKDDLMFCKDLGISERRDKLVFIKSEVNSEVMHVPIKGEPAEQSKEAYIHLHKRYMMDTSEIFNNEKKDEPLPKENMGTFSSSVSNEQSPHSKQHCAAGVELVEQFMKNTCPFILNNHQFLSIKANTMFCTICCIPVGMISGIRKKLEKCLLSHFRGKKHITSLNSLRHQNEEMKTVRELFVKSDIDDIRVVDNVKNTTYCKDFVLPGPGPVSIIKTLNHNLNFQQQTFNATPSILQMAQDYICHHKRSEQKKAFEKCRVCLKRILKNNRPSKYKGVIHLKVINKKCLCGVCKNPLSTTDLNSLVVSYFTHCESKAHKRRLGAFSKRKRVLKEKRKRRKEQKKLRKKKENKKTTE